MPTEEQQVIYRRNESTTLSHEELISDRQDSIRRWQVLWDASMKGRWTYRLITHVDDWLNRKHDEMNYYFNKDELITHGCFRAYLNRIVLSSECPRFST